jgi:DNA-directed RNA polymerase specialized sigma24 family protein
VATGDFAQLVTRAQQGDADAMERLLKEYGDAIQREIRFCLLDQRLRRVVGESDVFQSVIAQFALKLREGQYHFDTPSDLVGLLKTMARTHVAHLARFWQVRRRDLRKDTQLDAEGITEPAAGDPTASSVAARVELLEHALGHLTDRDRQILYWRQEGVTWPEIARRLTVPSPEALRKQHERALARVAKVVYPEDSAGHAE